MNAILGKNVHNGVQTKHGHSSISSDSQHSTKDSMSTEYLNMDTTSYAVTLSAVNGCLLHLSAGRKMFQYGGLQGHVFCGLKVFV